jgi:hypothetical protein
MDIEMFSDDSEEDLDRLVPAKISICLLIGLAAPQTRRTPSKSSSRRSSSSSAVHPAVNRARALTPRPNPRTRQRPLNARRLNCGLPTAAVKGALPKLTQKRRHSVYLAQCASHDALPRKTRQWQRSPVWCACGWIYARYLTYHPITDDSAALQGAGPDARGCSGRRACDKTVDILSSCIVTSLKPRRDVKGTCITGTSRSSSRRKSLTTCAPSAILAPSY